MTPKTPLSPSGHKYADIINIMISQPQVDWLIDRAKMSGVSEEFLIKRAIALLQLHEPSPTHAECGNKCPCYKCANHPENGRNGTCKSKCPNDSSGVDCATGCRIGKGTCRRFKKLERW